MLKFQISYDFTAFIFVVLDCKVLKVQAARLSEKSISIRYTSRLDVAL
jgi:hypothetical protein